MSFCNENNVKPSFKKQYRADIDGLRTLAVGSVFLYHLNDNALPGGYLGVDMFFVISGYLISQLILTEIDAHGSFQFRNFYLRRARRLLPAFIFTIYLSTLIAICIFPSSLLKLYSGSLVSSITSLSNFFFWQESGYFSRQAITKPLLHTWSLSVEEQFYLLWPASVVGSWLVSRWLGFQILLGAILIGSLYTVFYFSNDNLASSVEVFFLTPTRVFQLASGASIAFYSSRFSGRLNSKLPLGEVGALILLICIFIFDESVVHPLISIITPVIGTGLLIISSSNGFFNSILSNRMIVGVGKRSYSLYLIHWPIIVFYSFVVFKELTFTDYMIIVVVSFTAAHLMYTYIEQPFRFSGKLSNNKKFIRVIILLLLFPLGIGANIWIYDGWTWRVESPKLEDYFDGTLAKREVRSELRPENLSLHVYDDNLFYSRGSKTVGKDTVLVIGDSHSEHLHGFAEYIGSKYDIEFIFWSYPGCPPVFDAHKHYTGVEPNKRKRECKDQISSWKQYVLANQFDFVIMASRWMWMFEPGEYGEITIRQDSLIRNDDPDSHADIASSRAALISKLPSTLNTIASTGATPIIVSQVPNNGASLEGCDDFMRLFLTDNPSKSRCRGVDKQTALNRLRWIDETIRTIANETGAISIIPSDYFCDTDEDNCRVFDREFRLSDDGNHLNPFGSVFLARKWEKNKNFPFN